MKKKKNHSILKEQDKTKFLSEDSPRKSSKELKASETEMTNQKNAVTNMEEVTEMGLEIWKDGFWDKYHLLPRVYKIAAVFFIAVGILAVTASFVLFPVMESATGSLEQIKGIFLLATGSLSILTSAVGHYFHIRSMKGACGLDEEIKELADKKLIRQKLLSSYGKTKVPSEKLHEHKDKKKDQSKTQKKSHQNSEAINTAENGAKPIQENKKQGKRGKNKKENQNDDREKGIDSDSPAKSDASFEVSKPRKKKDEKNSGVKLEDRVINGDAPAAPIAPPLFMPTLMPSEVKRKELSNSAKKDAPIFSSKTSPAIQARVAVLAGLFRPNKDLLSESVRASPSRELG